MEHLMIIALASGPAAQDYEREAVKVEDARWTEAVYHLRVEFNWCFRRQFERDGHV